MQVNELTDFRIGIRKELMTDVVARIGLFTEDEKTHLSSLLELMSRNNDLAHELMPKPMTDQNFWWIIEEAGWGKFDFDYKRIKAYLMGRMDFQTSETFMKAYDKKYSDLERAVDRYLDNRDGQRRGHGLPFSGDDSFGDMIAHVIGLGKDFYEQAVKDPSFIRNLDIKESFAYCLPYKQDYEKEKGNG